MARTAIPAWLLFMFLSVQAFSQASEQGVPNFAPHRNLHLNLSSGFGPGSNLNSMWVGKYAGFLKDNALQIGGGIRLNNLNLFNAGMEMKGQNLSGYRSFGANGFILGLNLLVNVEYQWKEKWGLGLNTDLVGLAMGGASLSESFTVREGVSSERGVSPDILGGKVAESNVVGGFGRGTGLIASEIFATYQFSKSIQFRAGYAQTNAEIVLNQLEDRFFYRARSGFVGIRFQY